MEQDYRVSCCPAGLVSEQNNRIKVLDCTIRDGGICNDWDFDIDTVRTVYSALSASGVDYMEIGYQTQPGLYDSDKVGLWRFCEESALKQVVQDNPSKMKLCTMLDIGRIRPEDIPRAEDSSIDVLRIATYAHQMDQALELLDDALNKGYETFINVMAVSTLPPEKVDVFLHQLAGSGVHNVAIVDSFGAMYPYHIRYLVQKYRSILGQDIGLGVHCHNNQQQAFANSIAAADEGVDFIDATVFGMGRGAGNCPLELLLFYLNNPKHVIEPILELTEHFVKLRYDLLWGYHMPYAITGYLNLHPRSAIEQMASENRAEVVDLYQRLATRLHMKQTS
jgi:4-hydroxy 2-oxovalerate aldolase